MTKNEDKCAMGPSFPIAPVGSQPVWSVLQAQGRLEVCHDSLRPLDPSPSPPWFLYPSPLSSAGAWELGEGYKVAESAPGQGAVLTEGGVGARGLLGRSHVSRYEPSEPWLAGCGWHTSMSACNDLLMVPLETVMNPMLAREHQSASGLDVSARHILGVFQAFAMRLMADIAHYQLFTYWSRCNRTAHSATFFSPSQFVLVSQRLFFHVAPSLPLRRIFWHTQSLESEWQARSAWIREAGKGVSASLLPLRARCVSRLPSLLSLLPLTVPLSTFQRHAAPAVLFSYDSQP